MAKETKIYNLWTVFRRAEDLPGEWIAHVLELDLVTQGRDLGHALQMAHEAASMIVAEDLKVKLDPLDRRAEQKYWERFYDLVGRASVLPFKEPAELTAKQDEIECLAVQLVVHGERDVDSSHDLDSLDVEVPLGVARLASAGPSSSSAHC